jgi:hypothetical protein
MNVKVYIEGDAAAMLNSKHARIHHIRSLRDPLDFRIRIEEQSTDRKRVELRVGPPECDVTMRTSAA